MGKTIMLQGTASGVGKSTLMTGLCRIFTRDGYHTVPFKAQNLSNISHVLPDGREMARSQAIAAYACGLEPETDMNPLLLKPTDLRGSEVIFQGNSLGYLQEQDYAVLKLKIMQEVSEAHGRLLQNYDIVVAEGAGSPVELNLRENDVVNMGFARRANCPVLLVADINRGGVFASVYGTLQLLSKEERALVKGVIINKFFGLPVHFATGVKMLEELTGVPVLGVVPAIDLALEDEDALTEGVVKTPQTIGASLPKGQSYRQHMENELDRLAAHLRSCLNLAAIYDIVKESQ